MLREQDKSVYDNNLSFEANEGQRALLSCNKVSSRCPSLGSNVFSPEAIKNLEALGEVLRKIYRRLKNEGYEIVDGTLSKNKET